MCQTTSNLGEEEARHEDGRPKLDAEGRAVMVPRTFFPDMDLGLEPEDAVAPERLKQCLVAYFADGLGPIQ